MKFRQVVFATFGDTCHLCGHGGARQVDHVVSVLEAPSLAWELSNCRPAHGTKNRCPICGRCCNQSRVSGAKRPVLATGPVEPRLSGTTKALDSWARRLGARVAHEAKEGSSS
jgi:hypothetical protein